MSDDLNGVIDGGNAPEVTIDPAPEVIETPEVEIQAEPVEPETPAEPVVEEVPTEEPAHQVPLATMLEQRTRADRAEFELQQLKAQQQPQAEPEAPELPDMFVDPNAFAAQLQQQHEEKLNKALAVNSANMSQMFAEQIHGKEAVAEAMKAAEGNPVVIRAMQASPNPYQELMNWDKQQKALAEIGDDPAAFKADMEKKIRQQVEAELVAKNARTVAKEKAPTLASDVNQGTRGQFVEFDLDGVIGTGA